MDGPAWQKGKGNGKELKAEEHRGTWIGKRNYRVKLLRCQEVNLFH